MYFCFLCSTLLLFCHSLDIFKLLGYLSGIAFKIVHYVHTQLFHWSSIEITLFGCLARWNGYRLLNIPSAACPD